ncbi:aldose epimerase family protein [Burkholderia multivorans]|uniref:aldose epimerase family protein n=1 Tax=Burkholderia multivorans TaxID=87883 RepID=UPI001C223FC6|nr:aldose epimerase family protein [Burkholderia multivorans]MBU9342739.1 galactose mutarotase [Burkholderia multivorans]
MKRLWLQRAIATIFLYAAVGTAANAASPSADVSIRRSDYGVTRTGRAVSQYTLSNAHGVTLKVITYGGIVTALEVPDRTGKVADIVLGFDSLADYEAHNGNIHFGALIGRYANRIAHGRFSLDGNTWQLPLNDGPNTLHGGPDSFDAKVWTVTAARSDGQRASVTLRYAIPDGENGFPGTLTTDVTYTLTNDDVIRIDYRATTDKDTVVNLTNHSYFNLAGHDSGSVERQLIEIDASRFTPTDATSIPTGELANVAGTPMDLRAPTPIGARLRSAYPQLAMAHGYDHNWVLDHGGEAAPGFAARAYDPASGRFLALYTTQPGLQFYTSNGLNGSVVGKGGTVYRQTDAFALEAEHFPDSPNHPSFPTTVLKPGQTLHEVTLWKVGAR